MNAKKMAETIDKVFRPGSQAHAVASALIDGNALTRQELAAQAGDVSPTTIPRVVRMMNENGIGVDESVADDGRSKVYQVAQAARRAAVSKEEVRRLRTLWLHGDAVEIETVDGSYVMHFNADGSVDVTTPQRTVTIV